MQNDPVKLKGKLRGSGVMPYASAAQTAKKPCVLAIQLCFAQTTVSYGSNTPRL